MTQYNAMLQLTCEWCDERYEALRQSSQFCSPGCRVRHHRAKKKRTKDLDAIGVNTSHRLIDHKHTKRLDTIGGFSRDTELILRRLHHDTSAEIAVTAIDACWQLLVDMRRVE